MKTFILVLCLVVCPLAVNSIAVASTARIAGASEGSEGFSYGLSLSGHALRMSKDHSYSDDAGGLGFTIVAWLMSPESAHWQLSYSNAKVGEVTRVHRLFISRVFMRHESSQKPFGYVSVGAGANGGVFKGNNDPYHWDMALNTRGGAVVPISRHFGFDANADLTVVLAGLTRSDDFDPMVMLGLNVGMVLLL
ncbi:hypothetical protein GF356_06525 [candidate division GN15 bacterium]|nr:hypothetical protein [candidate division GN15 bacterium]